ncbi:MAG: acyl-CoA thioesterase [Methylocystaceae bacterium]
MKPKSASTSKTTMSELVLPSQANVAGNMHGGEVMKLMDSTAGVVAARHCHGNVVTLSVDRLIFKEPIFIGDFVTCTGELIYTGRTSMEVYVTVTVENISEGERRAALEGYFVLVALDRSGRPTPVPPLLIESEEQQASFDKARQRQQAMKENK